MENKGRLILASIMVAVILISVAMLYIIPERGPRQYSSLYIDGPDASSVIFLSFPKTIENVVEVEDTKNAVIRFGSSDDVGINSGVDMFFVSAFTISNTSTTTVNVVIKKEGDNAGLIDFGSIEQGISLEPGDSYSCDMHIITQDVASGSEILNSAVIWVE